MRLRTLLLFVLATHPGNASIIDRISIVVNNAIVKQDEIERDLRVTELLNREPLDLSLAARKKAANRLIDQVFIRREIRVGEYTSATPQDADQQLDKLKSERFRTPAAFDQALRAYGLSELDLRRQFQWQLSVLRFVDIRFKPGAFVTDDEVNKYYEDHAAELRRSNKGKSTLDDLRGTIQDILTGEKVNQQFFTWLDQQRKEAKISYHDESLQ